MSSTCMRYKREGVDVNALQSKNAKTIRAHIDMRYHNKSISTAPKSDISYISRGIAFLLCFFVILSCVSVTIFTILLRQRITFKNSYDTQGLPEYLKSADNMPLEDIGFRLPQTVRPLSYDLYLHPNIDKGTFSGTVSILIDVSQNRKQLILHQKDLNISSVSVKAHHNEEFATDVEETCSDHKNETLVIVMKEELIPGTYIVKLSFDGSLQNKIVGFYSSKYTDEKNETRVIATSKFEPTYARRSFPCFDEPGFKAEFNVKLVHPNRDGYNALSNMNIKSILVDQPTVGLTTVEFKKSVPMSTYLACFIVSDFVAVTKNANGLNGSTFPISVYTSRFKKEKGQFPLEVGVKVIEYYINLFQIDYPLPKLDMAAIPDFVSGAMENWGMVTYRESRLLVDKKFTSTDDREDIIKVIAHEFAHMWFGNLVTMAWWNDLWLNEGFATYMMFKSADEIFPGWHMLDNFAIQELHPAFKFDAQLSSHPIVQTVNNPDEINAIFDIISYQKGASVLRMLENFIGTDIFFTGITQYLKKFSYGNAETLDFFNALQNNVKNDINISAIMDTWTRQMGFPVVTVMKHKTTYTLMQKRFLANPNSTFDPSESPFGYKWTIPITYITSKNSTPTLIWFDKNDKTVVIELKESVEWIKLNADQVGYYRVNYDDSEWTTLVNVLRWSHKRFTSQDRTHLLEDAFSLAKAGELDYVVAMNMTLYLGNEKNYSPWYVAANNLKAIDVLLSSTDFAQKYRTYVRELVDGPYHDVTLNVDEMEDPDTSKLRSLILGLACSVGHVECLEEVASVFKKWINDEKDERPHPDIREQVYYYGMNHAGGEAEWNAMLEKFKNEKNAAEKSKLMYGLSGIRSSYILKKFISLAMDENYVRSQDALICLRYISNNPEGRLLVWDWVRENWQVLVNRYTLNDRYLGQLIPAITQKFSTAVKLNEIRSFFEKYRESGAGAIYRAQALETVETNIKWLELNKEKIEQWLDTNPTPAHQS